LFSEYQTNKMKVTFFSVIFAILTFLQVQGWIRVTEFNFNKNYTSHCFGEEHDIGPMEKLEVKRIKGMCAISLCREDRSLKLTGCAPVHILPPCYIVQGNMSKPFPQCCYEKKCDDENETK
jgi:hypothetical protein